MIVVADTTPLNYLILLGYADVLPELFGRVLVPQAVLRELEHPGAPVFVRNWISQAPVWFEIYDTKKLDSSLPVELGSGEREAISLALEISADILLIDEAAGRREASMRHITVTGTLAVLLQSSLRGRGDFERMLRELRSHGFWVSGSMESLMLDRYRTAKLNIS